MTTQVSETCGLPVVRWGPKASYMGLVESLPFEARYEEILRGTGELQTGTGSIYRDRRGRVRREYRIVEGRGRSPLELVTITDLAARTIVALDTASRTATTSTDFGPPLGQPVKGWAFEGMWCPPGGVERIIEGLLCTKVVRCDSPLGGASGCSESGEIWISDELKYSLLERVTDPDGEYGWRLYSIRRTEPRESLFAVPDGYRLVLRSGPARTG